MILNHLAGYFMDMSRWFQKTN